MVSFNTLSASSPSLSSSSSSSLLSMDQPHGSVVLEVRILSYDKQARQFRPGLQFRRVDHNNNNNNKNNPDSTDKKEKNDETLNTTTTTTTREEEQQQDNQVVLLTLLSAHEQFGVPLPGDAWMQDYQDWLSHPAMQEAQHKGHPLFESLAELHTFNAQGRSLTEQLRQQYQFHALLSSPLSSPDSVTDQQNDAAAATAEAAAESSAPDGVTTDMVTVVQVADYQPLYSKIQVGDVVSGWWHLKDQNYGFVIPIQHLPVSDTLKARLMAWRFHKGKDWLNPDSYQLLNQEGHELEQEIISELNNSGRSAENNNNNDPTAVERSPEEEDNNRLVDSKHQQNGSKKPAHVRDFIEQGLAPEEIAAT